MADARGFKYPSHLRGNIVLPPVIAEAEITGHEAKVYIKVIQELAEGLKEHGILSAEVEIGEVQYAEAI